MTSGSSPDQPFNECGREACVGEEAGVCARRTRTGVPVCARHEGMCMREHMVHMTAGESHAEGKRRRDGSLEGTPPPIKESRREPYNIQVTFIL